MEQQIRCANRCGFRVHTRYFVEKTRFAPGMCPRCESPTIIVEAWTDTPVGGASVDLKSGQIIQADPVA